MAMAEMQNGASLQDFQVLVHLPREAQAGMVTTSNRLPFGHQPPPSLTLDTLPGLELDAAAQYMAPMDLYITDPLRRLINPKR